MFNLSLVFCLLWLVASLVVASSGGQSSIPRLNAKDYQLEFLRAIADLAEQRAELSLNDYLLQLEDDGSYANYTEQLHTARSARKLQPKVLLIKQLLDAQHHTQLDLQHTSVLRNLLFLNRLSQQLRSARDASAQEIRQLRLHRLCQQFERTRPTVQHLDRLINDQTVGAALQKLNLTHSESSLNLNQFGQQLYERVKLSGAEIIDNYMLILRGLLKDMLDSEQIENTTQMEQILQQLDSMLAISDFFEKRQSVYAFLERNLATADNEQRRQRPSNIAGLHLTEQLLDQLKAKGLDLFVIFLFSNFEFLEQVHRHWAELLPQTPSLLYDETHRQLYDIQQLYASFKLDTESSAKYEAYSQALRRLHERTVEQGEENHHIFEMINNAAQNVGSVTFNMIKSKCKEMV
ncbi:uncharacterized protein LOC133850355 [Drosophila sulfurigaster albostrigata]|uniref:uncharacterized protein LOC133850355 n=1 Tax=Drosophila sulfurigaster albostrigata TaxID=89887 RepID=UPI002D21AF2C|nr:uncharacterized protein LOC133850355 [Drosophila sulfurigaster albostrigata]